MHEISFNTYIEALLGSRMSTCIIMLECSTILFTCTVVSFLKPDWVKILNCELLWRFFVSFFILTCWLEGLLAVQMQNNSQKKTPGVPTLNNNQTNQNFTSANALGCLKGAIQTVKENLCLEWVLILTMGLHCQPKMFCFYCLEYFLN